MNNSMQHGFSESAAPFCLGQPSHSLAAGEIVCRICGTLAAGAQIGIYRVQKFLGTGRSGRAYLAVHQRSGQPVAIRLTAPDTYTNGQWNLWEAARREVRTVTTLRHPAILPIFSCTTWNARLRPNSSVSLPDVLAALPDNNTYLLTLCQYVPGTLPHFIAHYQKRETQLALRERGASPVLVLLNLLQQAGAALGAAHSKQITHGAIVPGNILLAGYERLWLADFGLGKLQPPAPPYLPPELYAASSAYSQSGNISAYWNAVSPASDQYMFAVLCQQIMSQVLPGNEYERWQFVLQRAMQPKPERRYPTINLFVADLLAIASGANVARLGYTPVPSAPAQLPTPAGVASGGMKSSGSQWRQSGQSMNSLPEMTPYTPAIPFSGVQFGSAPATPYPDEASALPQTPAPMQTPLTPQDPLDAENWEKRGGKLFTSRDYEGALAAYHKALEMKWNRASLWMALGDTYFALERYKEALMAYEQAMYLNPDDPQSWTNRGTVLDALGRHQEALDCYERAEQL